MEIRRYSAIKDYEKLLKLFQSEKDWSFYLKESVIEKYRISLINSITYVAYREDTLVGYSRSIDDFDTYIYVCDLLVHKQHRGQDIGKQLLDCLAKEFPKHEIFIMSDVDPYYEKLGFIREGSLFKVI